jgi:hypothetical protein
VSLGFAELSAMLAPLALTLSRVNK